MEGMMSGRWKALVVAAGFVGVTAPGVRAQTLGTFRWQLQPFCNVVTLNVRQDGGVYTLDGFDDQCGAAAAGSVLGTAFLNPDGTIGIGLGAVVAPGAAPLVLYARVDLASVSGTWSDSAGNSGAFVFTPGPGTGGAARPVPPNGIRPGSITAAQIAPGAIGTAQIAVGSVTAAQIALGSITAAQLATGAVGTAQIADASVTAAKLAPGTIQAPIAGACSVGEYVRGVTAAGALLCEPSLNATVSTTVDGPPAAGSNSAIAIGADGLPIISHYDATAQGLRVTRCGNAACTAGNVSGTIDAPGNPVGLFTSVAIGADALPIISHHDIAAVALRVTHCGDADCSTGNVSTTVDTGGRFSSMAIGADGLPLISHDDGSRLKVTHCGNVTCTAGNTTTIVDGPGMFLGRYGSLAIGADGLPVISYQDGAAGTLRVAHCGNLTCTSGNAITAVDAGGGYTSLAIGSDGLPVISHRAHTALRVTHCGNAACTSGNVSTTVDDPANEVGAYTSIAIGAAGLPIISHQDASAAALRLTRCGDPACTSGNESANIDDPADNVGEGTSMAIGLDGLAIISHANTGTGTLRVTKFVPSGASLIRPGSITGTHIAPGSITAAHVAAGSLTGGQIALGSLTGAHLAPGSVTGTEIAAATITAAKIAPGSITGAQVAAGSLTGAQIATGTITASHLAPGTVQVPIVGTCPVGAYLRGVDTSGSVICEPVRVAPASNRAEPNPANIRGDFTSIAIGLDGLPVISHHDRTAGTLRVVKCENDFCSAQLLVTAATDDPANSVGWYTSIAVGTDGLPIISHQDDTAGALRVTKCGDPACATGNVSTTVDDPADTVGLHSSIAIGADGLPVISHWDVTAGAIRVTHCGNDSCTAGNVTTAVDSGGGVTSLAIGADGLPVIGYGAGGALRVTHCGNLACTAGNVSTTVDDPANTVGSYSSLAIGTDGLPVIAHHDLTAGALRVTHCGNVACTAGNVSTTVDDPLGLVGVDAALAIGSDGLPVIAHRDEAAQALRVTKCSDAACTGAVSTVLQEGGQYPSIAIGADGQPVISHQVVTEGLPRLFVTKCGTQNCR